MEHKKGMQINAYLPAGKPTSCADVMLIVLYTV